jgi:hypothetical protein
MPTSSIAPPARFVEISRQLAALLEDLARALEHTARLAEDHAARRSSHADAETHDIECRRAERAWSHARVARDNADRVLRTAQDLVRGSRRE